MADNIVDDTEKKRAKPKERLKTLALSAVTALLASILLNACAADGSPTADLSVADLSSLEFSEGSEDVAESAVLPPEPVSQDKTLPSEASEPIGEPSSEPSESNTEPSSEEPTSREPTVEEPAELLAYALERTAALADYTLKTEASAVFSYAGQKNTMKTRSELRCVRDGVLRASLRTVMSLDGMEAESLVCYDGSVLSIENGGMSERREATEEEAVIMLCGSDPFSEALSEMSGEFCTARESGDCVLIETVCIGDETPESVKSALTKLLNTGSEGVSVRGFSCQTRINGELLVIGQSINAGFAVTVSGVEVVFDVVLFGEYLDFGKTVPETADS